MITNFIVKNNKLYIGDFSAEELIQKYGSSIYVYDAAIIRRQYRELKSHIPYPRLKFHYACKQNTNVELMKLLRKEGSAVEAMSKAEIAAAYKAGFTSEEIMYTCSYITTEELKFVIDNEITINLDSLNQLEKYGKLKPNSKISLRINQGIGAGGHSHFITGGQKSKFGIDISQLDEAKKLAKKYKLQIVGVQQHIGTDILDEKIFMQAIKKLFETARQFDGLEFIDFGGGFGIPYKPGDKPINMEKLGKLITEETERFVKTYGQEIEIKFEPGRFLVGESGVLLSTITDIKTTPYKTFIGLDTGMNQLVRPAMYGAYHEIVNASRVNGPQKVVSIVGNICESADFFARDRNFPVSKEGDVVAILDAGASGYVMASFYNGRSLPAEVLVDGKKSRLIRKRIG